MGNPQLSFAAKLKRAARKLGAKKTDDPDGVIGTLQAARRLVQDEDWEPTTALMAAADTFAAPKDSVRAFWGANHALMNAPPDCSRFDSEKEALLATFDAAIKAQGAMNARKGAE